jgi:hypothetical protein
MRFEMYVRDGELGEIFENRFRLFHKYPVSVQCTQTHVVLSKKKRERSSIFSHELERKGPGTNLYGSPPVHIDAPRRVLEGDAPAHRDEARRQEGFYAVRYAPDHLLRLGRRSRFRIHLLVRRLVKVDFGHGRLDRAQQIPREGYVDFVDW